MNMLPSYFLASLCNYQISCILQSSSKKPLNIPKCNLKSAGKRLFSLNTPSVLNLLAANLPVLTGLSQFKAQFKASLFPEVSTKLGGPCLSLSVVC